MTTQRTCFFVIGLPGAGKSSYVDTVFRDKPGFRVVRLDTIRKSLGHAYHANAETAVHFLASAMIACFLLEGFDVVVDESLTDYKLAALLVDTVRLHGGRVEIRWLNTRETICRSNRLPHGYPVADFDRKSREWRRFKDLILGLSERTRIIRWEEGPASGAVCGMAAV